MLRKRTKQVESGDSLPILSFSHFKRRRKKMFEEEDDGGEVKE